MNIPETPETDLKTFYVIDFDRTLADSDKLLDVFLGVVSHYLELPRDEIEKADADVKARGDSFDTASYVRDRLIDEDKQGEWDNLVKQFIHESRALNMLLPGAEELLTYLASINEHFGILTYGNPLWQGLKLTAAGFKHVPHIVIENKEKGRLVKSWQHSSGSFHLPQEFGSRDVDRIIMIDDKAVSFADFPSYPSLGYYVVNMERALPSQRGKVPTNVIHTNDLYETRENLSY